MKNVEEPKPNITSEFAKILGECQMLYNLVYGFLSEQTPQIKSKKLSSGELTDFGFLCRELENLFDELRKECKARKDLCGSIIAYKLVQESLTDPTAAMQSRGTLATGTPDVKMQVGLPQKFTDEYFQLTDYFGVSRSIAGTGILRLDWNAVVEYCTKLANEGKEVPLGFGKKYPLYQTTFKRLTEQKKADIGEDSQDQDET